MTRIASETTKRVRALGRVERARSRIRETKTNLEARVEEIRRTAESRISALEDELKEAREAYADLTKEDCPL